MHKILLVCIVNPKIGLGHLSRLLALAQTLKKDKKVVPEFLILGDIIKKDELNDFKVNNCKELYEEISKTFALN